MGLRDIDINSFCVAVAADNLLFKIHAFCHAVKPEDVGQDLDPVGAGILILAALAVPSIEKLAGSFPLLCICHCGFPSDQSSMVSMISSRWT